MRLKCRWIIVLSLSVFCLCMTLWLTHSQKCPTCNACDWKIVSTPSPTSARSHLTDTPNLNLPGWVQDCITWDKRLQLSVKPNATMEEFTIRSNLGPGENVEKRHQLFQKIFDKRDWPADDPSYRGLKASGPGAMLRHAQGAIATLHGVVTKLRSYLGTASISLLDVPCGDLQWMPYFLDTRSDVIYTGADIVPDIISNHRKKFKRIANATFIEFDIVTMPLDHAYDLVLVRDLLQHLWLADAMKVLGRISRSGSRFLLATTFRDTLVNEDVDRNALGGRKSAYNLELAPFSLAPPICSSYDWNTEQLSLWHLPLQQIV